MKKGEIEREKGGGKRREIMKIEVTAERSWTECQMGVRGLGEII